MITPILFTHIAAGAVGLLAGDATLTARKGGRVHQLSGRGVAVSMLIMAVTAAYLGVSGAFGIGASLSGVLVFYLVATGWLTMQRKQRGAGIVEIALLVFALALVAAYATLALHSPARWLAGPLIGLGLAAMGAAFDFAIILRGGISGAGRARRHVWRMCVPLFQACSFFFLAQPDLFVGVPMLARAPPPLIVVAVMTFWLARIQFTNTFKTGAVAQH